MAGAVTLRDAIKARSNPFPGLRPFEYKESDLFFGRDGQVEKMIAALFTNHFLAVVGASGSGKSSLVRAGLLPALVGGMMRDYVSRWRVAIMRPGDDPIGNLARSLNKPNISGLSDAEEMAIQINVTEATLRLGSRGLIEAIGQTAIPPEETLLIVVDQFEELFRFAREAGRDPKQSERYGNDAAAFVKLLLTAREQREVNIFVVLTMRSDFLGDCSQFWNLPEAINESQYLVPRLTREQLREVIAGPIALGDSEITNRLVNQLLNDLSDQDQLPVLQHLLMRIWDECREQRLGVSVDGGAPVPHRKLHTSKAIDLCCYEAVGGMAEALSHHADEAFNQLPDDEHRKIAEQIFKRLTEKTEDNREVRHPVAFPEICALIEANYGAIKKADVDNPSAPTGPVTKKIIEARVRTVIETFRETGRSFLMPPVDLLLTPQSVIDISHESLIRRWKRLVIWVEEEAEAARIYRRLAETAALFRAGKANLARDRELQFALDWRTTSNPTEGWARRYHADFQGAMSFLDQSLAAHNAESVAEEARRQTEIRRARLTALVFALAFVVALVTLSVAIFQWRRANTALSVADAEQNKSRALLYDANIYLAQRDVNEGQFANARSLLGTFLDPRLQHLRSFGWYYLWGQLYEDRGTLSGHSDSVNAVAFSADQKTLATASTDGTVKLWEIETGKELAMFRGHQGMVNTVAFSANGKSLATGGEDGEVKLWDVVTRQEIATLHMEDEVRSVAFSTNGKVLASAGSDSAVALWDAATGKQLLTLEGHSESVNSVTFSPDGKTIATGSDDATIRLWDATTGRSLAVLKGHTDVVNSVAFSPDGKLLASGSDDKIVRLWDVTARQELEPLHNPSTEVFSVAFSADGETLATGQLDNRVRLWDVATREQVAVLGGHYNTVRSVVFSQDGKTLATGSEDHYARLWGMARGKRNVTLTGHTGWVMAIAFSPDGRTAATGSVDKTVRLWDVATGKVKATLNGHSSDVISIAFSPDGKTLATGGFDKTVKLWNIETGKEEATLRGHAENVLAVAFSPDGKMLASGGDDKSVKLWDLATRTETATLSGHAGSVWSIVFSARGDTLITGGGDATVKLWNVASRQVVATLTGHTGWVNSVALSPDGKTLASGSDDGSVRLWDVDTRKELAKLIGHSDGVKSVVFSPDGKTLATASYDKTVKLWDVTMYNEEATLTGHIDGVIAVAFSADGKTLASASKDMKAKLWFAVGENEVAIGREQSKN